MASKRGAQKNKEAQTQNEGPVASRLRSHSKEVQQLSQQQNEGPIASRLRSKTKTGDAVISNTEQTPRTQVKKSSDKPSQNSRNQKDNKSNNSAAKKSEVLHTQSTDRVSQPSTTDNRNKCTKTNGSTPKIIEDNASSSRTTTPPSNDHHRGAKKIIIKDSTSDDAQRTQDSKKQNVESSNDRTNQNSSKNQQTPKKMENNSAAKKSYNSRKPSSSKNGQKKRKKNKPSPKPAANNSINDHPVCYIRWKGFDTATGWNCPMCEKDLASSPDREEYKEDSYSDDEGEYKLEHLFNSRMGLELEQHPLLPEVSVLPCTHAFHSMCLHLAGMDLIDSPCPVCITLL